MPLFIAILDLVDEAMAIPVHSHTVKLIDIEGLLFSHPLYAIVAGPL